MSDSENTVPGLQAVDSEVQPYVDAADRLERTLDAQLQTIRNIDSRAGFIIRVVGILLGVVVSAASILAAVSTNGGGGQAFSVVAAVAVGIAAIGLLNAMVAAVVTYLRSSPVAGRRDRRVRGRNDRRWHPHIVRTHVKIQSCGVRTGNLQ